MADQELFPDDTPEEEVAVEVEAVARPEPAPEPVKAVEVEARVETMVPLAALQAERESARTLKQRLERLEAAMNAPKTVAPPDLYAEPERFQQYIEQTVTQRVNNVEAEMSERFARTQFGSDAVDAAFEAAQAQGTTAQFIGKKDPWGELVKWHKAQTALAEIGDDPAAYRARVAAEIREQVLAEITAQSVSRPQAPSLAGQTTLGTRAAPIWSGPTPLADILG